MLRLVRHAQPAIQMHTDLRSSFSDAVWARDMPPRLPVPAYIQIARRSICREPIPRLREMSPSSSSLAKNHSLLRAVTEVREGWQVKKQTQIDSLSATPLTLR